MRPHVWKLLGSCVLLCVLAMPLSAQNTKGDVPQERESRFRKSDKKKPAKRVRSRRINPRKALVRSRDRNGGERVGRPVGGRTYGSTPSDKPRTIYPPRSRYVNNRALGSKRIKPPSMVVRRSAPRSASGSIRRIYPSSGRFVNSKTTYGRKPPGMRKRVEPRSKTQPYLRRRSINAWTNYPKPRTKWERPHRGDISGRRIRTRNYETQGPDIVQRPSPARSTPPRTRMRHDRPSQPRVSRRPPLRRKSINAWATYPRSRPAKERAYRGDITGRRLRTRNYQSPRPSGINAPSVARSGAPRARTSDGRIRKLSATPASRRSNIYPSRGAFVNNRSVTQDIKNRNAGAVSRMPASSRGPGDPRKRRARVRSASRQYTARRSINMWANFRRPKRKAETAVNTDIAGRPLRYRNFETQRPVELVNPTSRIEPRRKFGGERAWDGRSRRYRSKSRPARAWLGDVATRRLRQNRTAARGISSQVPPQRRGMRYQGERYTGNIRGLSDGFRNQGEEFSGTAKARRRVAGGGSVSGQRWNNEGRPIARRMPGIGAKGLDRARGAVRQQRRGQGAEGRYSGNMRFPGRGFNNQGEEYAGSTRARRQVKGGGSVSGQRWNNEGRPIMGKIPGIGSWGIDRYRGDMRRGRGYRNQGEEFSGSIKARRPQKGGGTINRNHWNNRGTAVAVRVPPKKSAGVAGFPGRIRRFQLKPGFNDQGEEYTGNIKTKRSPKGGGSISAMWNNQGRPIPGRTPGIGARGIDRYQGNVRAGRRGYSNQGEEYAGNIKARRPEKGGGSISRMWNNKGQPIPGRTPGIGARGIDRYQGNIRAGRRGYSDQGEEYAGNIKAKRPEKGGGSISGMWNNKGQPIPGRAPGIGARGIDRYQGNIRAGRRGYSDQGEEYAGNIKAKRPEKGGGSVSGKSWNNNGVPIPVRVPVNDQADGYRYKDRQKYARNPNASRLALKQRKPTENVFEVDGLQVRVRARSYTARKGGPDGALPGIRPSAATVKASTFHRSVRRPNDYARNRNSHPDALKVRQPGRALARAADYQGNIRLRKFELFKRQRLHPDAQFAKSKQNNVDGERGLMTNFKLWWARFFRKNETQPDHLKDRNHKPRYDKGEAGLWYD